MSHNTKSNNFIMHECVYVCTLYLVSVSTRAHKTQTTKTSTKIIIITECYKNTLTKSLKKSGLKVKYIRYKHIKNNRDKDIQTKDIYNKKLHTVVSPKPPNESDSLSLELLASLIIVSFGARRNLRALCDLCDLLDLLDVDIFNK